MSSRPFPAREISWSGSESAAKEEDSFRKLNLPRTYCLDKPLGFFKLLEAMQKSGMFRVVLGSPPS